MVMRDDDGNKTENGQWKFAVEILSMRREEHK